MGRIQVWRWKQDEKILESCTGLYKKTSIAWKGSDEGKSHSPRKWRSRFSFSLGNTIATKIILKPRIWPFIQRTEADPKSRVLKKTLWEVIRSCGWRVYLKIIHISRLSKWIRCFRTRRFVRFQSSREVWQWEDKAVCMEVWELGESRRSGWVICG